MVPGVKDVVPDARHTLRVIASLYHSSCRNANQVEQSPPPMPISYILQLPPELVYDNLFASYSSGMKMMPL